MEISTVSWLVSQKFQHGSFQGYNKYNMYKIWIKQVVSWMNSCYNVDSERSTIDLCKIYYV